MAVRMFFFYLTFFWHTSSPPSSRFLLDSFSMYAKILYSRIIMYWQTSFRYFPPIIFYPFLFVRRVMEEEKERLKWWFSSSFLCCAWMGKFLEMLVFVCCWMDKPSSSWSHKVSYGCDDCGQLCPDDFLLVGNRENAKTMKVEKGMKTLSLETVSPFLKGLRVMGPERFFYKSKYTFLMGEKKSNSKSKRCGSHKSMYEKIRCMDSVRLSIFNSGCFYKNCLEFWFLNGYKGL